MLNKNYFVKGIEELNKAFPRYKLNEEQIVLYYKHLKDYDNVSFRKAIYELVATSEFMPTVASIRKLCENYKDKTELSLAIDQKKIAMVEKDEQWYIDNGIPYIKLPACGNLILENAWKQK